MYSEPRHKGSRHSIQAFAPPSHFGRYFAKHDFAAHRPAMTTLNISIGSRRPGRPPNQSFQLPRSGADAGRISMGISIRIRRLARVIDKGRTSLFGGFRAGRSVIGATSPFATGLVKVGNPPISAAFGRRVWVRYEGMKSRSKWEGGRSPLGTIRRWPTASGGCRDARVCAIIKQIELSNRGPAQLWPRPAA